MVIHTMHVYVHTCTKRGSIPALDGEFVGFATYVGLLFVWALYKSRYKLQYVCEWHLLFMLLLDLHRGYSISLHRSCTDKWKGL